MRRRLYDDDHEAFRAAVRTFVDKEILPHVDAWSAAGIVPRELFTAAGRQGFLGMDVPEEYGGGGVARLPVQRRPHRGAAAHAATPARAWGSACTTTSACRTSSAYCTEEQKQRWLPGIVSGELITAIGMTEPGIGSDLASMSHHRDPRRRPLRRQRGQDVHHQRHQRRPGDHRGEDRPGAEAQGHVAAGRSRRGMPGFTRGRNLDKLGQHAQDTAELFFSDVRVPVGEPARPGGGPGLPPAGGATCRRSGCRSRSPPWPRCPVGAGADAGLRHASAGRSASRSGRSRTRGSCWPRSRPRSTSRSTTSTTASARSTTAS